MACSRWNPSNVHWKKKEKVYFVNFWIEIKFLFIDTNYWDFMCLKLNRECPQRNFGNLLFQKWKENTLAVDNRQLFGVAQPVNQLYLSFGRIHKMGDHGPDITAMETGRFSSFQTKQVCAISHDNVKYCSHCCGNALLGISFLQCLKPLVCKFSIFLRSSPSLSGWNICRSHWCVVRRLVVN